MRAVACEIDLVRDGFVLCARFELEVAVPEITLRHEIDTDEDTYWSKIVFDAPFNEKMAWRS